MNDPVLAQALAALDTADVATSDDAGCTDLLAAIRKVRGWVDAVEAQVTPPERPRHRPPERTAAA